MTRRLLILGLVTALMGCEGNTGFELEVTPQSAWKVPEDFDAILVQVVAQTESQDGVNDETKGQTYTVTPTEQPPYVIVVLANGTQYAQANEVSVSLMQPDGGVLKTLTQGDVPFTEGQLTPVQLNFSE